MSEACVETCEYQPDVFDRAWFHIKKTALTAKKTAKAKVLDHKLRGIIDKANAMVATKKKGDEAFKYQWQQAEELLMEYCEGNEVKVNEIINDSPSLIELRDLAVYDPTNDVKNKSKLIVLCTVLGSLVLGGVFGLVEIGYKAVTSIPSVIHHFV